jgi:ArsR family transcriptional regulator
LNINYAECAAAMKALSDETRLKIVVMISSGELCACEILEQFKITQPTLSYHMKILCESGLVEGRKDGIWMKYSTNANTLDVLKNLFDDLGAKAKEPDECCRRCNTTKRL